VLQRKCACGTRPEAGGECEECRKKKSFGLQGKLKVSDPGDIYEREADRIADQVMARATHPANSGAPPRIQRLPGQSSGQMDAAPAGVDHVLTSPGRPLEPALRQDMEQRFGHDFSHVRVHADDRAAGCSQEVGARAFTVGKDIAFGAGEFAPRTHEGRRLLAHELVHVIQQNRSESSSAPTIQRQKEKKAKPAGQQVIIIANGYAGYSSDTAEIERSESGTWLPNTPDFARTASDTQKGFQGASTADEFFGALQSATGKIRRAVFIGHGNPGGLGLSGTPTSVFGNDLTESDLTRWQSSIDSDIKPKFSEGATLDIYACNVAAGATFIKALATSLGICVRAFSGAINWCLGHTGQAITSRGRIGGSGRNPNCADKSWHTGVNTFVPPDKACP
jgi:hypothetical protein